MTDRHRDRQRERERERERQNETVIQRGTGADIKKQNETDEGIERCQMLSQKDMDREGHQ